VRTVGKDSPTSTRALPQALEKSQYWSLQLRLIADKISLVPDMVEALKKTTMMLKSTSTRAVWGEFEELLAKLKGGE